MAPRRTVWIVVTDQSDRILLGRRTCGTFAGQRVLVGGGVSGLEDYINTAIREVREETGLSVMVDPNVVCIITAEATSPDRLPHEIHVYRAMTNKVQATPLARDDIDELRFYSRDELPWNEMTELTRLALRRALP